jgi:hypothetical protein
MRAITIAAMLCAAAPLVAKPGLAEEAAPPLVVCGEAPVVSTPPALTLAPGDVAEAHPAICGSGKVPRPIGRFAPKGLPRIDLTPEGSEGERAVPGVDSAPESALFYFYNTATQFGTATTSSAKFAQYDPTVGVQDYHSLIEMAGESADGSNIIEVGWTVDPSLNGDSNPHLFVYHWISGSPTCYNGCGWVQVSTTRYPGMTVTVSSTPQAFAFHFDGTNWWIGYQGEWIGYFPGSLWAGQFTQLYLTQWFGEVAAASATPCTQMGDGVIGTGAGAAMVKQEHIDGGSGPPQAGEVTQPGYYALGAITGSDNHFGGPGAC